MYRRGVATLVAGARPFHTRRLARSEVPPERPKESTLGVLPFKKNLWWPEKPEIPDDAPQVTFTIRLPSGQSEVQLVGREGESVEEVAKRDGYVEGACDGNCQCSTCHVFIPEEADRKRLGMPDSVEEFELDMLELAATYEDDPDASRLACQMILKPDLEGLVIQLPKRNINHMDHIPFE